MIYPPSLSIIFSYFRWEWWQVQNPFENSDRSIVLCVSGCELNDLLTERQMAVDNSIRIRNIKWTATVSQEQLRNTAMSISVEKSEGGEKDGRRQIRWQWESRGMWTVITMNLTNLSTDSCDLKTKNFLAWLVHKWTPMMTHLFMLTRFSICFKLDFDSVNVITSFLLAESTFISILRSNNVWKTMCCRLGSRVYFNLF